MAISPFSLSSRFAISNLGAPSAGLAPAPGIVTSFDMGRTFKTPILKLGVNCIAAISNKKVSCTDVCIVAVGGCGLATGGAGALCIGAIGVWVVSGMVAGVVICGNTGSVEIALGKSYTDPGFASAVGN